MFKKRTMGALFVLSLFALIGLSCQNAPSPTSTYSYKKILVEPHTFILHWNFTKTELIGEIHVMTHGWIGFGITPNGGMDGSDVFVAWIQSNGQVHFTDRHIKIRSVIVDSKQDWQLLNCFRKDNYTIIKFKRNIDTCDPTEDLIIEEGTPKVIYAWSTQTPSIGSDISYHGTQNRGSSVVQLISILSSKPVITAADNLTTFDLQLNVTVPNGIDTYYHCQMFKLPNNILLDKHHLLRVETIIQPGNEKNFHHWIIYQCDMSYDNVYLQNSASPFPGHCFDNKNTYSQNALNTWNKVNRYCYTITLAWAIGGSLIQEFPDGLGFPFGGPTADFNHIYIQVHYDNPSFIQNLNDKSAVRLHFTQNLRKTEIGIYTVGSASNWLGILVPPGVSEFALDTSCRSDCLDVTIFVTCQIYLYLRIFI